MKKLLSILLVIVLVSLVGCTLLQKPCEHEFASKVVSPTCTAEGYTEHTCSKCGESYQDTPVEKTAHRFNGGDCVVCSFAQPTEVITADISWYSEGLAVFTVTTAEQLAGIAQLVNEGNTLSHMQIYLGADIDLGYKAWIPIGTAEYPFGAKFVGNGHTISNLRVSVNGSYVGLFGNVMGELSDFTVKHASVFVQGANKDIGVACGSTSARISGVKVDGFIDAKDSTNVGGIAGYTSAAISASQSNTEVVGLDKVGGIVGYVSLSPAVFENLINLGDVYANNCAGGIFGSVNGTANVIYVDECENYGDITGKALVGGIAGYIEGKVDSVIQSTKSSAVISGDYYVGGLVGEAVNVAISNCSNEGSSVSASSCLLEGDKYYAYLGGYVGKGYSVDNCVNAVELTYLARGSYVGGIAGYLEQGVTNCSNSASIAAGDSTGGIAGYVQTSAAMNVLELNNSGNITGKSYVGGIAGEWYFSAAITLGESSNSGKIEGASNVGGIVGKMDDTTASVLTVYNANNTGDVHGTDCLVGGLFGNVYGKDSSSIANCSVSANVEGLYLVGGLVGRTYSVIITNSSNEGSTVSATGFVIEGEENHAYLGGYVGYGYKVSNCVNDVDITYTSLGSYIGGIAGFAINSVSGCTNNGDISAINSTDVGGVVGMMNMNTHHNVTHSDLANTGNVTGKSNVGGVVGAIYQSVNVAPGCNADWYSRGEPPRTLTVNTTINSFSNLGSIIGETNIGAVIGYIAVDNTHYYRHRLCYYPGDHDHIGYSKVTASDMKNDGTVNGNSNVGEVFGYFWSDTGSTLDNYTVTGKVTVNGAELEGTYDVGANTNLTLSERVGPETEVEGGDAAAE